MTFEKLRITGPGECEYQLGQPMFVYDGAVHLGTLDPVPLRSMGTEVHLEHFVPTQAFRDDTRRVGRLIFLEVCALVAERFHQVQAVSFVFSRKIEVPGTNAQHAMQRAETMARIGAVNIQVTPKSEGRAGHFVVSGVWIFSRENYAALTAVLEERRAIYRAQAKPLRSRRRCGLCAALRGLVRRRKPRA